MIRIYDNSPSIQPTRIRGPNAILCDNGSTGIERWSAEHQQLDVGKQPWLS